MRTLNPEIADAQNSTLNPKFRTEAETQVSKEQHQKKPTLKNKTHPGPRLRSLFSGNLKPEGDELSIYTKP